MSVELNKYRELHRVSKVVRDEMDYEINSGESNPVIFEDLVEELLERFPNPVIWEPFAGHNGRSKNFDFCEDIGVELIAYDIAPFDFRVEQKDSTTEGPDKKIEGAFFHPPYYGAFKMSEKSKELSNILDDSVYWQELGKTIKLAYDNMVVGGLVAAIGRDYRFNGKRIRFDHLTLEHFSKQGFKLIEVWSSEPDVVQIFER